MRPPAGGRQYIYWHPSIHPSLCPPIRPYLGNVAKLIRRRRISLKRDYVQRNRNKKVIYRSFVTNSYNNITSGSSFNALVNSGIVHPTAVLTCPFIGAVSSSGFVHIERTVVFPFCTSNVMQSVRTSHLLLSSEISRRSSAGVSARSLMGSPRCDLTLIRKVVSLLARAVLAGKIVLGGCQHLVL
jgi:hypothetical protein